MKNKLPPFVPLLITTIDSPAWKSMSHGAKSLYVALKRRCPMDRNRAYISYREAQAEIQATPRRISDWFRELQHYGFIVLASPGCLGMEGKGKSPHWRLTEKGATSRASADGLLEPPTRDFQNWTETKFKKTESRYPRGKRTATPVGNGAATPWETPKAESAAPVAHIELEESATHVGSISSYHSIADSPLQPECPQSELKNTGGVFDERISALSRWGNNAKKPWTAPTILADEPQA